MFAASISNNPAGDHVVVTVDGDVDLVSEFQFRRTLSEAARRRRPIVVDLTGVNFFGVCGIHCLQQLTPRPAKRRRPILIAPAAGPVVRLIEVLDLADCWQVVPTVGHVPGFTS
jgi:anti-anti-sigma factor